MSLTFGSLFAGVGGFDLGFERAGWECKWQVEWDARCRSVLARHWPGVARYGDVRDVRDPEPVDLITYGFPCQDLSVAGNRAGLDGDRSGLFFEATRIIREMREATNGRYPTWAVAENVPGLLSADGGHAMGRVLDELADIGAVGIEWAMLDAQHFGVPQRRRRVFVVADFRAGGSGSEPLLPVSEGCQGHPEARPASRQAFAGTVANGVERSRGGGGLSPSLMAHAQRNHPDEEAFVIVPRENNTCWAPDRAAPLLSASQGGLRTTDIDGGTYIAADIGVRRLTPRECDAIQGWPRDHTRWDAEGNELPDTFRYRVCGNGVAAPVAEWVARQIARVA